MVLLVGLLTRTIDAAVYPPHSTVEGKTLEEWSAEWWKWAYRLPADRHPFFDETGTNAYAEQPDPVFYLVGVNNRSNTAARAVSILEQTYLFFPVINFQSFSEGQDPWGTIKEEICNGDLEIATCVTALSGSLDDQPFTNLLYTTGQPVTNLFDHLERSPEFAVWMPLTNNIVQYWGFNFTGFADPSVADGYWLMLAPLPPGQHVLHFWGAVGAPFNFSTDVTYSITVQPMSLAQAVQRLAARLAQTALDPKGLRRLQTLLDAARLAFETDKPRDGIKHLRAFQKEVTPQLADTDADLAARLVAAAQEIIDRAGAQGP
jgi:hypothetical protein